MEPPRTQVFKTKITRLNQVLEELLYEMSVIIGQGVCSKQIITQL